MTPMSSAAFACTVTVPTTVTWCWRADADGWSREIVTDVHAERRGRRLITGSVACDRGERVGAIGDRRRIPRQRERRGGISSS